MCVINNDTLSRVRIITMEDGGHRIDIIALHIKEDRETKPRIVSGVCFKFRNFSFNLSAH